MEVGECGVEPVVEGVRRAAAEEEPEPAEKVRLFERPADTPDPCIVLEGAPGVGVEALVEDGDGRQLPRGGAAERVEACPEVVGRADEADLEFAACVREPGQLSGLGAAHSPRHAVDCNEMT